MYYSKFLNKTGGIIPFHLFPFSPMIRFILLMLSLLSLLALKVMAQTPFPKDLMVGYATLNGGTTGGQNGTVVTVSDFASFKTYAENSTTPYIILVSGEINSGNDKGASIRVGSNKSIIGIGSTAFLNGVGLRIGNRTNIIIRNIKFTLTSITNTTDPAVYDPDGDEGRPQILTNGGDCIKIEGGATNIWIDHCEFYSIDPAVQTNQDLYDGLVDATGSCKYITISWCYFHDHHKCSLVGGSDSDNYDRMITYHHNYYYNISQRTPSYRFGNSHIFNNYYLSLLSSGINSRMGACLKIEGNYFEDSDDPITTTSGGLLSLSDNTYLNCTGNKPTSSTCSNTISYDYSLVIQPALNAKDTVLEYAGTGIVTTQNYQATTVSLVSPSNGASFTAPADIVLDATATAGTDNIEKVKFYNGSTFLGEDDTYPYSYTWNNVPAGVYSITAMAISDNGQNATSVAKTITVSSTTGVSKSSGSLLSEIYPNPSNDIFTLNVKEKISRLTVFNLYGEEILFIENILPGEKIELGSQLEEGLYTVRLDSYSRTYEVIKISKIK